MRPKIYYHGTAYEFETFAVGSDALGIWLVDEPDAALSYAYTTASRSGGAPRLLQVEFAGGQLASRVDLVAAISKDAEHGEDQDRRTRARKAIEAAGFCGFDWGGGVIQVFRTDLLRITEEIEAEFQRFRVRH